MYSIGSLVTLRGSTVYTVCPSYISLHLVANNFTNNFFQNYHLPKISPFSQAMGNVSFTLFLTFFYSHPLGQFVCLSAACQLSYHLN